MSKYTNLFSFLNKVKNLTVYLSLSRADMVFMAYTWWLVLPVMAMPAPEPDLDPSLRALQARFIQEAKLVRVQKDQPETFSYVFEGAALLPHGASQEIGKRYQTRDSETRVGSLVIKKPAAAYFDHKGLYHGYRLLFGHGYIVPSLLVKRQHAETDHVDFIELQPVMTAPVTLKDLREHSHEVGVHLLGMMLFPGQGGRDQPYDCQTFAKRLDPETILLERDAFKIPEPFQKDKVPESVRTALKNKNISKVLAQWLAILSQEQEKLQKLGYRQETDAFVSLAGMKELTQRGFKLVEAFKTTYSLRYQEVARLLATQKTLRATEEPRPLKEITLLTLHELLFKHQSKDWTEVFEIMGETFPNYAVYFSKHKRLFEDQDLLKQAFEHNRSPAVLTFMKAGGLREIAPTLVHDLVQLSGQKLDPHKASRWLRALKDMGVGIDQENSEGQTPLDIALSQQKHRMIRSLIEQGAGTRVKPHLIIDYLNHLKGRAHQSSSKPLRRGLSKGPTGDGAAAAAGGPENSISHHSTFEALLDVLEFRNHQLRWQLMLEALLPVNTGQPGLKIKTTDYERVLKPEYVQTLWKGGKAKKPDTFQSFTQTTDQHKYGRRTVGKITDGRYTLYVKQYPELPGIEEAIGFLTRQLLGYGAPNTLLANIEGYAYLFSEGIPGKPLHDYLTGHTDIPWPVINTNLDAESTSGMILLAMLTNPEDGKPDNYIVQERPDGTYQLVGIDNDHAFVPAYSKPSRDWLGRQTLKMNVKTILFALDQMNEPLHHNLKKQFLSVRPGDIIREWVARLTDQAVRYNELFSEAEILNHFTTQNTFLGIALHPSIVEELYKNLSSLQSLIQSTEDLTHMDILRNFHRTIYLRYQDGFTEHPTANPLDRFKHVDGKEYKLHTRGSLQTLSTGKNLLSTNMMITTRKDLQDYVKRARGQEIGLEQALKTLEEIEANDTRQLAEQAMAEAGSTISLDQMTDGQREDFFERLDWARLPIQNQQALIQQMARESWGDPTINKSPWRGKLTFKNCAGFTEGGIFARGNASKINWQGIRRVDVTIDEKGGENALKSLQTLNLQLPEEVELYLTLKNLDLDDEELNQIIENAGVHLKKLHLYNLPNIRDPEMRQKVPKMNWQEWMALDEDARDHLRMIALEGIKQQSVDLSDAKMGITITKVLLEILPGIQITTLKLGGNNIGNLGVEKLARALPGSQIFKLSLEKNKINDVGLVALAGALIQSQVKELCLWNNQIGPAGAETLATALPESSVNVLNLRGNNIGASGAKSLARVLPRSSISTLDLQWNNIGDAGAEALAQVLSNSPLNTLNLLLNSIGDVGAEALLAALPRSQLVSLFLLENETLRNGSTNRPLDLWNNKISSARVRRGIEMLNAKKQRRSESRERNLLKQEKRKGLFPKSSLFDNFSYQASLNYKKEREIDLTNLLTTAGLTGEGKVQTYTNPLDWAQYYLEQQEPHLYPKVLELALSQIGDVGSIFIDEEDGLALEGAASGEESSTDVDTDQERALDLLRHLSIVYPKALLPLADFLHRRGLIKEIISVLRSALVNQVPDSLETLTGFYKKDGHPVYAELMAENYLEGYMNPVDLKQGETWLRLALERDRTNLEVQTKLAQVLMDQGGLEDKEIYPEIMTILDGAKEESIDAQALLLWIEEKQANRAVRDHGISGQEQRHIDRQQRLLRVLHQAQFVTDDRQRIDLTPEQKEALQILKVQQSEEQDVLTGEIAATEEELAEAGPMDRRSVEEGLESLKQRFRQMQQKHRAALKGLLFPEGVSQAPQIKQFYETVKEAIRQQISLIDAIEGGLAERKKGFLETQLTEAVGQAVSYVGGMLVSNMPVPGNGILAMIIEKAFEKGIEKITEIVQDHAVGKHYDKRAERERGQASQAMGGFDQAAFVAKGLASIYTYRLQNIIPYLTEKSAKELSSRLGLSVVQYLQDQKRCTNPETLTQLATLSFYHRKGSTIGDRLQKARGKHGLKLNDGKTFLSYREIFKAPQLETTDGAQYQMGEEASARIQIVPLIERVILQSPELQGKQVNLKEVRMPQLSPLQVSLIEEQDDADYIRRAVEFVQDMAVGE